MRIGSAREQWTLAYDGQGRPQDLLGGTPTLTRATQLPSATIDAMLGGGQVDGLAEGVRIRRAANTTGTTWQEVRFRFSTGTRGCVVHGR